MGNTKSGAAIRRQANRRDAAEARQAAYRRLTLAQKLARAYERGGASPEYERLLDEKRREASA